jgi:hypothetical protein
VEVRGGADEIGALLQGDAASGLRILQLLDIAEMAIGEGRVGEGPQVLGGLEFGGVGRQKEQMDMLRHAQPHAGMPAGAVEHEDDLLGRTGTDGTSKGSELHLKEGNADRRGEMEDGAAGGGMDEADEVAPREPRRNDAGRERADVGRQDSRPCAAWA